MVSPSDFSILFVGNSSADITIHCLGFHKPIELPNLPSSQGHQRGERRGEKRKRSHHNLNRPDKKKKKKHQLAFE